MTASTKPAQPQPVALLPFVAAAHEHVEPAFDVTLTNANWGTSSVQVGPYDVPSYGFIRNIYLLVEASAGGYAAGTYAGDAPWSLFDEITLLDVNGAPIFGPLTGYQAMLANLYGGYDYQSDPTASPGYQLFSTGTTVTDFAFALRIPVEISHHDGLGSLANQNAAASYKLRMRLAPATSVYSVAPTTRPTVRIRGYLEAWSQPSATDLAGRPQEVVPPRHGTTQFWTATTRTLAAGTNNVPISRVGNLIRTVVMVFRDGSNVRQAWTSCPDPLELRWDARQLLLEPQKYRRDHNRRSLNEIGVHGAVAASAGILQPPNGVIAYSFDRTVKGGIGDGSPALWLPTVQSTRLESILSGAASGSVDILVNDVAPAEISPAARFVESSSTGFQPSGGSAPLAA